MLCSTALFGHLSWPLLPQVYRAIALLLPAAKPAVQWITIGLLKSLDTETLAIGNVYTCGRAKQLNGIVILLVFLIIFLKFWTLEAREA